MKKLLAGLLCVAGLLAAGCETDIPSSEVKATMLSSEEYCVLSGGVYIPVTNQITGVTTSYCHCGADANSLQQCAENVNCALDSNGVPYCGGVGFVFLTQGLCTMRGVEVCSDRVDSKGTVIGYYTKCGDDNRWTDEKVCDGKNSCKIYEFNPGSGIMSSKCGDCQNDGVTCIGGKEVKN